MSTRPARLAAAAILMLVAAIYYSNGIRFQLWPDSLGYLEQALGIRGERPFTRPADRTVGYPLLIAAALSTPAPLLAIWLAQAVAVIGAFVALHRALMRRAAADMAPRGLARERVAGVVLVGLALAWLYSIIHIQVGAMLTEIVFAGLALWAVLATIAFARLDPDAAASSVWQMAGNAALVAIIIALPLIAKPHWLLAAGVLGVGVAFQLARLLAAQSSSTAVRVAHVALAIAIPIAAIVVVTGPDRILASQASGRDALFGPRTVFCNHARMIDATLARRPDLRLQEDAAFESSLRAYLKSVTSRHVSGWRRLGFDGDLCSFDGTFHAMLDRQYPDVAAQRRFLLGAVLRTAVADPLPYVRKVLHQHVLGFTTAFEKFAHHATVEQRPLYRVLSEHGLAPVLQGPRGVLAADTIGPLANAEIMKRTWRGRAVQALLAVVFFGLTALLCVLALLMIAAPFLRWRQWGPTTRRDWLVWVAIPLAALLAHHALVALTHTFDVWRYGFNMFFVNLLFIGTSSLFALRHLRR